MITWAERINEAQRAWDHWTHLPGRFRMDRVLKEAGVRDLVEENQTLRTALEQIRKAAGPVCPEYEVCIHPWCEASYAAWATADRALTRRCGCSCPDDDHDATGTCMGCACCTGAVASERTGERDA